MQFDINSSRRVSLTLAALAVSGLAGCGKSGPPLSDDGWYTLFDGNDLDYWNVLGDANWALADGAVGADQSTALSYLVSRDSYSDFQLELEFWVDSEANSGVFLRCQDPENVADTSCYEVNIFDTRPDQTYRTGAVVHVASPAEFVYTGGQWNRYEITAQGSKLKVVLNGHDMVDAEDSMYASGPIALQYGSGTVKFRKIRLRAL